MSKRYDLFLSFIIVIHDNIIGDQLIEDIHKISALLSGLVTYHEIILIDNSAQKKIKELLKNLCKSIPDLQVFTLNKKVNSDIASICGIQNSIGDYIILFDRAADDLIIVPELIKKATTGIEVVFARNTSKKRSSKSYIYKQFSKAFYWTYKKINGIDFYEDAPRFRIMSRSVVNFILQHDSPDLLFITLPSTSGFSKAIIDFSYNNYIDSYHDTKPFRDAFIQRYKMLISGPFPIRLVSITCLSGAILNLLYSFYVIVIYFFKKQVVTGWTSISLQMSGMFFLISVTLFFLSEYIIHISQGVFKKPLYTISEEFRSSVLTHKEKFNVVND